MQINFKPIGNVKTTATPNELKETAGGVAGELEIYPEYEDALNGIDGYSHVWLICYLDRLRPEQIGPLQIKPRCLLHSGYRAEEIPLIGVFAIDSPTRPNPIGLSLVRLIKREGNRLFVEGLDVFDGTPILDIKGYGPGYRAETYTLPTWFIRSEP
jgi:tRNA-Thr(GGU) m(6)t(6)A37 methyltransferase TsaA